MTAVKDVATVEELTTFPQGTPIVLLFYTIDNEECSYMREVIDELSSQYQDKAIFCAVDAKNAGGVAMNYLIHSAPTVLILKDGVEVYRSTSNDAESLLQALENNLIPLNERLAKLIHQHPFMIFIKGTPSSPKCGFTRQLLSQLKDLNIDFDYFDILSDETVRQGLKEYSHWPTYPQIYVKGELLGGLDIFTEMVESGQIKELIQ